MTIAIVSTSTRPPAARRFEGVVRQFHAELVHGDHGHRHPRPGAEPGAIRDAHTALRRGGLMVPEYCAVRVVFAALRRALADLPARSCAHFSAIP
jgi:hypothetical protein